MNSFRPLVYPFAEANATGSVCRDSGLVQGGLTLLKGGRRIIGARENRYSAASL